MPTGGRANSRLILWPKTSRDTRNAYVANAFHIKHVP